MRIKATEKDYVQYIEEAVFVYQSVGGKLHLVGINRDRITPDVGDYPPEIQKAYFIAEEYTGIIAPFIRFSMDKDLEAIRFRHKNYQDRIVALCKRQNGKLFAVEIWNDEKRDDDQVVGRYDDPAEAVRVAILKVLEIALQVHPLEDE